MTREILFRGKRIIDGEWVESNIAFVDNTPKGARGFVVAGYDYNSDDVPKVLYPMEVKPETIGQFTGLKDKNGKKVFEGDLFKHEILRSHPTDQWGGSYWISVICEVCFRAPEFSCRVIRQNVKAWGFEFNFDGSAMGELPSSFVVIGNIHDNPSLLKNEDAA